MHSPARVVVGTLSAVVIAGVLVFAFRSERDETGAPVVAVPSTGAAVGAEAALPEDDTGSHVPGPPSPQHASAVEPTSAADWDERSRTEDLFSFAQAAAAAALNGDGRAGWLLSLVLVECKVVLGRADRRDPALRRSLAEARLDDSKLERCEGFRAADPLDRLPDEAKRASYWRELAIAAGDGRAIAYRALVERACGEPRHGLRSQSKLPRVDSGRRTSGRRHQGPGGHRYAGERVLAAECFARASTGRCMAHRGLRARLRLLDDESGTRKRLRAKRNVRWNDDHGRVSAERKRGRIRQDVRCGSGHRVQREAGKLGRLATVPRDGPLADGPLIEPDRGTAVAAPRRRAPS